MDFLKVILTLIPVSSILASMVVWFSQRKIALKLEATEKLESDRRQMQLLLIKTINANMAVTEALALAYKDNLDTEPNPSLDKALEYMQSVKHEQKDFFQEQTVQYLNRGGEN